MMTEHSQTMLEDQFDFINEYLIRIAGTRVGIETVVRDYLQGASPEEIVLNYPTLTLEQVYVTITYYLTHQEWVAAYMERLQKHQEDAWVEQQHHPSEFVRSLRERLAQQRQTLRKQNRLLAAMTKE
jgi:uncharacterized protein (DUF433 family)